MNVDDIPALNDREKVKFDEEIDKHAEEINKDNKFKIRFGVKNHFLPPIEEILSFFNINHDMNSFYKLAKVNDPDLPRISHGSLHQIHHKGVGKAVYKKIIKVLVSGFSQIKINFISIFRMKDPWTERALKVGSNAAVWCNSITVYNLMANNPDYDQEELSFYQTLSAFISFRCQQEVISHEQLSKEYSGIELSDALRHQIVREKIKPFFLKNTQLDESVFSIIEAIYQKVDISSLSFDERFEFMYKMFVLENDFLINIIACYDLGYIKEIVINYNQDEILIKERDGIISRTIKNYSNSISDKTCFYYFLSTLQEKLAEFDIVISNRKLASYIPMEHSDYCSESLNDAQYNVLKKWYKGEDLPSNQRLRTFIDELIKDNQLLDNFNLFWSAKVALGFDDLLRKKKPEMLAIFGDDIDVTAVWKKSLCRYHDCYNYHCDQYFLSKDS